MRHNVAHRKLGRVTEHRLAMIRNQAISLLRHERIETTIPKRGVASGDANGKALHARRLVLAEIPDKDVVTKLFDEVAPRFAERPGGYTRILRVGFRRGDAAEVAQVELVGSEYDPRAAETAEGEEKAAPKKSKGVGERIKQVAQRVRGGKTEGAAQKAQAKGQTRGRAQK